MKKVKVIFPDGSEADIDESDLQAALSAGAKRSSGSTAAKSTSMVFPDGSIANIDESDIATATKAGAIKKKDGSNGVAVESNGTPVVSAPTILQSTSQDVSFGQYDVFNNPLNIKKPVVSIAGVNVPINAPIQDVAPIPEISNQFQLADQLQSRINTKTYTPEDIGVVAQSMKVSLPAANAYMEGKVGTGTVIHFDDVKAERQNQLRATVQKANTELGRNDNYDEIFASADLAGAYIQKIEGLYENKANEELNVATKQAQVDNPTLFALGSMTPNRMQTINTQNAAQEIKNIISNDIIDKISSDKTLNTDQKVKKIYSLVDSRDQANVRKAIDQRLSPLSYMMNVATGGNTSEDIDLLNSTKAGIELKVNRSLSEKVSYNEALKKSVIEEYAAKVDSQEISAQDEKARDAYAQRISDIESETTELSKEIVPDNVLYEKYPVLYKSAVIDAVNEFNAIQSGNVVGYEDGGYQGVTLAEHLRAKGFDNKDQRVKDAVNSGDLKDYSFFGSPVNSIVGVFTGTAKGVGDLTGLRDTATQLAEKKEAEIFSTQVGVNDELQLTEATKIGQNIGNTTGQVIGQGLLQWGTGGLGRLAGLTKTVAANAAFFTSGALVGYDSHLKESYDLPIETDAGRVAYAGVNSIFEGAIEKLFPEAKLFQIPGFKDAAVQLGSKLSAGELTEKLTSELLTKAKNSVLDFGVKYGENISKESLEEGLTSAFNSATKLIVGDPNTTYEKAVEDVKNTVIQTAIGTSLIGGFGANRDVQSERNVSAKSTIYNAAIYHDEALDAINLGFEGKLYDAYERDAKIAVLNTARQSVSVMEKTEQIEGRTLSRPNKELYVANLTAESILKGQKAGLDEVGQAAIDVKVSNLQNQRQQILKGEVLIDDNGNITTPVNSTTNDRTTGETNQPLSSNTEQPNGQGVESGLPSSADTNSGSGAASTTSFLNEERVPDITVGEVIDKVGTYKGEKGRFYQDGQTVIFKVDGQNREYELGNVDEISNTAIGDFGIYTEQSVVSFDDAGNIKVRDESYVNNFSDPFAAINRDADGNIVSVNLETPDGKKRTFRGNVAEDVAYNIHLKEITKDNETRNSFENFINGDADAQEQINNAAVPTVAEEVTSTSNGEVSREKIEPTAVIEPSTVNSEEVLNNDIEIGKRLKEQQDKLYNGELKDNEGIDIANSSTGIQSNGLENLTGKKWGHGSDRASAKDSIKIVDKLLGGENFNGDFGQIFKMNDGNSTGYNARENGKFVVVTDNPQSINGDALSQTKGTGKLNPKEVEIILNNELSPFGQELKNKYPDYVIKDYNGKEFQSENKPIQNEANGKANTEDQQGNIQTEAAQPAEAIVTENTQPTETLTPKEQSAVDAIKGKKFTGSIKNWTDVIQSDTSTPAEKKQALKELTEQLLDPKSEDAMGAALGQKASDAIYDLENDTDNATPPPVDAFSTAPIPQADGIGIIHAETSDLRKEAGLPEYGKEAQTFEQWDAEADERINNGEMPALLDKLRNGGQTSAVETRMMGKYIAYLKVVVEKTKSNEDISRYHEAIQLSDKMGGTENARGLVARKGLFIDEGTLADFFQNEMEAAKVDVLTDEQKAAVEKEHTEISEAEKKWNEERDRLNQQIKDLQAEQEINKNKPKKKSTSGNKKTHEDYVKEREAIVQHLREKLRKARSGTNVTIIPYAADLFAAAPDVARLVKSLVEEGVTRLADVIDNIHETLKDGIPDITKDDVRDIIAGAYNAPQKTRSQTAKELFELKQEAKLINKLIDLQNGKQPVTNRQQIEYNQQLKDLRSQIAKFRKENITNDDKLQALKSRYAAEIKKVEDDLNSGNFLSPQPPAPKLKLDKDALAAKDKLIKLKGERKLRLIREQYRNRPLREKAIDNVGNILNIPRALMTTLDFSAVLRQGLIPSIAHPVMASRAVVQMFKSAWTQKEYDRWFFDLENSPKFELMKESGLALTDNTNPNITVREEDFMTNLAEKIPIVGQQLKTKWGTVPGLNLLKKSERAYGAYINKIRVDLFERYSEQMEERGMTFENSPEQFKQMAEYINNATGRGSLGKALNNSAALWNGLFFSPRLIAARLNMLTYLAQPRFYNKVPKEIRKAYFADMAKFIATGISILALAELGGDDEDEELKLTVEADPRSSDFGKIKQGDTRWDIWGGFQPYLRVAAQIYKGQRKSTTTGKIYDITGEGLFSKTRGDVLAAFARGKLAPVPAMAVDIFSGRTAIGEKLLLDEWGGGNAKEKEVTIDEYLKDHLLPLTYTGVKESFDDKGVKSLFTVGIPTIFGIGVQSYK